MRADWLQLIAVALCACGDNGEPEIRGEHHSYVVSRHDVPASNTQARQFGLDLDGDTMVDNQLGMLIADLAAQNFVQSQVRSDGAIDRGDLLQLIDLQRPQDDEGGATGFAFQIGADPQPAPCADPLDVVCRHHLDGNGVFMLAGGATDPPLRCVPSDLGFECRPGHLSLQLGIFGRPLHVDVLGFPPLQIDLLGARVVFEDVGDGALRGRIGGAVTHEGLQNILATFLELVNADVQHDCTGHDPACDCRADSAGKTYLGLFDGSHDCTVSFEELEQNSLVVSWLTPDVVIEGTQSVSLGIGFEAVPATIRED